MKPIVGLLFFFSIVSCFTDCKNSLLNSPINTNNTYRDIPGITKEEISAIEEIKLSRQKFSFGVKPSAERFVLPDGNAAGFTPKLCELLSMLFGIQFVEEVNSLEYLENGLENDSIDFICEYIPAAEQKVTYYITNPIAERKLGFFTYKDSIYLEENSSLDGLNLGFFDNTRVAKAINHIYPELKFNEVPMKNSSEAVVMLQDGTIDAFILDINDSYYFSDYDFIRFREIFPLINTPLSIYTMNSKYEPVISVINKYIKAGGAGNIYELYHKGNLEYYRQFFINMLKDEEREYLFSLINSGSSVPIALESNNYPVCFYNDKEKEYQGIAPDIIDEISNLTNIRFEVVTNKETSWGEMLDKLMSGEVAFISELLYSEERKNNFLWSERYFTSNYALLSKFDYPNLEMFQVNHAKVGVGRQSAYEEIYNFFFPDNSNLIYYNSREEGLEALEKNDIDLFMASENTLLALRNYHENPYYKTNILFNSPVVESYFGFNKNEEILCSIFREAQAYIGTRRIIKDWTDRVYDYSRSMTEIRYFYALVFAFILLFGFIVISVFSLKNSRLKKYFENRLATLTTVYNTIPDLVYCMDTNCRFTNCNNTYEDFTGFKEGEIIGKTDIDIYAKVANQKQIQSYMNNNKKVINEGKIISVEEIGFRCDNTNVILKSTKTPLIQNGKVVGLLGISRDITEYKAAEEAAQEASRAKSNFLAKMSHEIRTPMNAIIGMTELALREKELDVAQKHIFTVKQAGTHLLSIINDILDFSKIEMGKMEIIPADYSFTSLINDVISIIRMRLIDSQIRFAVNVDSKIPDSLFGDETRIRQVLLNILNNAIKYTDKGFVSFTVTGEIIENDTIILTMEVMDTGKGIKEEDIKNLFGDYTQFDYDNNRGIDGVGLGLAISWNIVNAMDGKINVYSEFGKGSTFSVVLPQKIHSYAPLAAVENPGEKSVIVYERREIYANSIIKTIDNLGIKYDLVSDDAEFKKKLSMNKYSFIFISYALLEKNRFIMTELHIDTKIAVLSEFGESIPNKKLSVLSMPVYSVSVANLLNGILDNFNFDEYDLNVTRFIAPTARILIVDDIYTNLKVAEGLMLPYKMQVDLCKSGKEAIEAAKENRYDIIFMDHKMPEMDGITAANYIRELDNKDPYYKNLPIVVLTANAITGIKDVFFKSGFQDYLSKPIDTVKLNNILEKWIPRSKQKSNTVNSNGNNKTKGKASEDTIIIDGINTERGIFLSGGENSLYLETLNIYYNDGIKKIEELKNCLETDNIPLFTTHVHALKSASANIGAEKISEAAGTLEAAGEILDKEYIKLNFGRFLSNLEILLNNINIELFLQKKSQIENKVYDDISLIKNELNNLKEALNSLDAEIINSTIDSLCVMNPEESIKNIIQKISEKILLYEYDKAAELIRKLLDQI